MSKTNCIVFPLFLLLFLLNDTQLFAQNSVHRNAVSYKFLITDYNTLDPIFRAASTRILHPDEISYGMDITYWRNINSSLNLALPVRFGTIDSYHDYIDLSNPACVDGFCQRRVKNEFFSSLDILAAYKFDNGYLLPENFPVAPYLKAGLSALYLSVRAEHFDFQLPVALGCNVKIQPNFSLQAQMEYRYSMLINKQNLAISAGICWIIKTNKNHNHDN